jgi:hypothetical protein
MRRVFQRHDVCSFSLMIVFQVRVVYPSLYARRMPEPALAPTIKLLF